MPAIAMGLILVGYGAGLAGYCWIRGYNITLGQMWSPTHWYTGPWPPAVITDPTVILPGLSSSTSTGNQPPIGGPGGTGGGTHGGGSSPPPGGPGPHPRP